MHVDYITDDKRSNLEIALYYVERCGFSVVPIRPDGSKSPIVSWTEYQNRQPTDTELRAWFTHNRPIGLAVVAGAASRNLVVIDFDEPGLHSEFEQLLEHEHPGLLERMAHVETPRGNARHYYARYVPPDGVLIRNCKLACAPDGATLIETRGQGGYAVLPGSHRLCHPTQRPYKWLGGAPMHQLPVLSSGEINTVLSVCRSLNQFHGGQATMASTQATCHPVDDTRVGDIYNQSARWEDILEPHGWVLAYRSGSKLCWRRPEKTPPGISATTGCVSKNGRELFYVFSSNAAPFEAGISYCKFATYTLLNHSGNFHAATRALAALGYQPAPLAGVDLSGITNRQNNKSAAADDGITAATDQPARAASRAKFMTLADATAAWLAGLDDDSQQRFQTGFDIDLRPSTIVTIGGGPGSGKTTLALQMTMNAVLADPELRAVYACCEMQPPRLAERQLILYSGLPAHMFYKPSERERRQIEPMAAEMAEAIGGRIAFLENPYDLEHAAQALNAFHADLLVIDYIQRIPADKRVVPDRKTQIDVAFNVCRRLADAGAGVLIISSLSRPGGGKGYASHESETAYNGTSDIEYGCDEAYILRKNEQAGDFTLVRNKARYRETGEIRLLKADDLSFAEPLPVFGEEADA